MTTLILAIGNTLLSDDGVGIYALHALREGHPAGASRRYLDGGTLSFTLLPEVEEAAALVVFDAAQLGAPPGTVRTLEGEEMERYLRSARRSVHEVGLAELIDMARLTGRLPPRRALIAIQPASVEWGEEPTAAVRPAVAEAAAAAAALLERWEGESDR